MISVPTINSKGTTGEKSKLPEAVFGVKARPNTIAAAVRVYLSNQRRSSARVKTRGEVKKTTAKMYRQKGTGRARHGSYSAPVFVGGGVAHGPTGGQNYKRKLTTTQMRQALFAALSLKTKSDMVVVTGGENIAKTKDTLKMLTGMGREKMLVVVAKGQGNIIRAVRNLKQTTAIFLNKLNVYKVVASKKLIMTVEAVDELVKTFSL